MNIVNKLYRVMVKTQQNWNLAPELFVPPPPKKKSANFPIKTKEIHQEQAQF